MSSTVGVPTADEPAPTATGAGVQPLWRRYRAALLVLLGILLVATAIGVAQTRSVGGRLDPRSADPAGSRALATLLDERGVRVDRRTDPAGLAADPGGGTVVLVGFPGLLADAALRPLGEMAVGTLVLVSPGDDVLGIVSQGVERSAQIPVRTRSPGCAEPAATAAGDAVIGGATYTTADGTSCYGDGDTGALVTGRTGRGAELVVLGSGQPLTNGQLADEGNAALALNLLGGDGTAAELRWLVPAPGSAADQDGSLASILPAWVAPALLQLLFAGLLLALWRGRRLGPPVTEPLPVVVRAAEAVEGRARLYRRAQARDRAAEALRAGVLARLVPRLGIEAGAGGEPPPEAVVAAVATRSGWPDAEVHAVLFGPPPGDDAGLVRLTETLDSMVRSTLDPEVARP